MAKNTMQDLRKEVASRLRNSLHGKEIDLMESVRPRIPHMLGVTPIGKVHDPNNEKKTLLDTQHQFWKNYEEDIRTKTQLDEKIQTAIRSLKQDNIFRLNYPYGEEGDIIYVEVDRLDGETTTRCKDCETLISATQSLNLESNGKYSLIVKLDCPSCEFSGTYERRLIRR